MHGDARPSPMEPRGWGLGPALVLGALVAGSALQLQQPSLWPAAAYATGPLLLLLACLWRAHRRRSLLRRPGAGRHWPGPALLLGAVFLGGFGATGWRAVAFQEGALQPALEGRDLVLVGLVAAMPQRDPDGLRLRLTVETARDARGPVAVPRQIQLSWFATADAAPAGSASLAPGAAAVAEAPAMVAGERWRLPVRLRAPHGSRNPHGFDYELWMWEQGLQATGYVRTAGGIAAPQRLGQTWRHPLEWARQAVRDRIFARLGDARAAGWIAALVTGDQAAIERSDWDVFRATGVAHLMSISGLHVTMFAWLAAALVGWAWRRSAWLCLRVPAASAATVGGVALAAAYAAFSGWGVPAQRTVWMLLAVACLRLSGRRWPWPVVWLLACAAVVACDPWALMQPGFWLSFTAVGVLFAAGPSVAGQAAGVGSRMRAMLREQSLITLALAPLTLVLFGQVSVVGLLANALAIPTITLLVTPLALAGVAWGALWVPAAACVALLARVLEWLAAWPFAQLTLPMAPWWIGIAGVAGGVLLALRLPWSLRLAGLALALPVLLWQPPSPPPGHFMLLAADIGQGNAVLVRTARHALLYDAGPAYGRDNDAGGRVLVPLLRALDLRLDLLVLSHRDTDHVGGAAAVLAAQPQAALLASIEPEHPLRALRAGGRCEAGQRWSWDGVEFVVLHPAQADYADGARVRSPNNLSCVVRITASAPAGEAAGRSALLAGDVEIEAERSLVESGQTLKADYLLVPHHGSKTSSSPGFLDAVAPSVAVVQAGYRNRFGHPAAAPMARYAERGIRIADTVHCGAVHWRSEVPSQLACERARAPRYWHHRAP